MTSLRNASRKTGWRALVGLELYLELVMVTVRSFDGLLDVRVTSLIIVGVKIEASSGLCECSVFRSQTRRQWRWQNLRTNVHSPTRRLFGCTSLNVWLLVSIERIIDLVALFRLILNIQVSQREAYSTLKVRNLRLLIINFQRVFANFMLKMANVLATYALEFVFAINELRRWLARWIIVSIGVAWIKLFLRCNLRYDVIQRF